MKKETIKEFMPIMQAMLEGKTIQSCYNYDKKWVDVEEIIVEHGISSYRIKTEPKYRPFKNADECWTEMLKHQPFGWVRGKVSRSRYEISCLKDRAVSSYDNTRFSDFEQFFHNYDFADGTPFGIKVEE